MARNRHTAPATTISQIDASTHELASRAADANATPKHLLCATFYGTPEIKVEIHTAGRPVTYRIPVREAARSRRLIKGMNPEDALSIGLSFGRQLKRETIRYLVTGVSRAAQ